MLKYTAIALILCVASAFAFVRLMPLSGAGLHVDPETAERPARKGHVLVRAGGDIEPPILQGTRADVEAIMERIILATPRTAKLKGDLSGGSASYVTRSAVWGFPDIASVKIIEAEGGGVSVLILSRQLYGLEDFGVNKARVEGWLAAL